MAGAVGGCIGPLCFPACSHLRLCESERNGERQKSHPRPPTLHLPLHPLRLQILDSAWKVFACSCDPTAPLPGIEWRAVCVCVGWCVCVRRAASSAPAYQSVSIATSKKSLAGMRTLRLRGALPSWPRSKLSDSG